MRARDAIACLALVAACSNDEEELRRAIEQQRAGSGIPASAVGGGIDEETGLPVGYPTGLPFIPGGRAISGGVDPGRVRTATVLYDDITVDEYKARLASAMQPLGQRIESDITSGTGARLLRLDLGEAHASAIVNTERGGLRIDFTMLELRSRR